MEYSLLALWIGGYLLLGLLGTPLANRLFSRLWAKGTPFAIPVGLAFITFVVFWLGQYTFGRTVILIGVVALGTLSLVLWFRGAAIDWRSFAEMATVFVIAFCFVISLRAVDPAVHPGGGEKFLDFGLLKTTLRADRLPPGDFWFANEPVRYYYVGHLMAAIQALLLQTPARYAYNLTFAGVGATLLTTAYGLAGAIADEHGISPRTAGVFAVLLTGVAGNLYAPVALLVGLLPDGLSLRGAALFGMPTNATTSPSQFHYGEATRVIGATINEFPVFSFLNGDLHAHVMSTPFLLLTSALCYRYSRSPPAERSGKWLSLLAAVPVLALLIGINTWSFPTGVGLVFLTVYFASGRTRGSWPFSAAFSPHWLDSRLSGSHVVRAGRAASLAVLAGGSGLVAAAPFVLQTASGRAIGLFPSRSPLGAFLLVNGGFLLVYAVYLGAWFFDVVSRVRRKRILGLWILALMVGSIANFAVVVLLASFLGLAWLGLQNRTDLGFETVLFVASAGLLLIAELAYVEGGAAPGRINTVFKIYMQVWVLLAVGAGVVLARMIAKSGHRAESTDGRYFTWRKVLVALFLGAVLTYPALALPGHYSDPGTYSRVEDPTLDALAFVGEHHPQEARAIAWLDNRSGQPTIVSAPGYAERYRWVNAPATLTGIPTVAGWGHEIGYRDTEAYMKRVIEVKAIFEGSTNVRRKLLRKHNVSYIYIGPIERMRYGNPDFRTMDGISRAYRDSHVTIYAVNQTVL